MYYFFKRHFFKQESSFQSIIADAVFIFDMYTLRAHYLSFSLVIFGASCGVIATVTFVAARSDVWLAQKISA